MFNNKFRLQYNCIEFRQRSIKKLQTKTNIKNINSIFSFFELILNKILFFSLISSFNNKRLITNFENNISISSFSKN